MDVSGERVMLTQVKPGGSSDRWAAEHGLECEHACYVGYMPMSAGVSSLQGIYHGVGLCRGSAAICCIQDVMQL